MAAVRESGDFVGIRCCLLVFSLIAWLVHGNGNLSFADARMGPQATSSTPSQSGLDFDYERSAIRPTDRVEHKHETKYYQARALAFPSIGDNGQAGNLMSARYYESKLPGKHKLIIVLPIWGAQKFPPRNMTKALLRYSRGDMNVLRILGENSLLDWTAMRSAPSEEKLVEVMQRMVERVRISVIDIRRWIDWAEAEPKVDESRIGLVGFSMGANVGSLVLATEPRIAAGALAMGGANPHEIFATCFVRKVKRTREVLLARFNWTAGTLGQKMQQPLAPINPVRFAGTVNPQRIIMLEAGRDTCIPQSGRDALWYALGKPTRVTWPHDHNMAFLNMTFLGGNTMAHKIFDFLNEAL
ncbi:MAG: dienelactone hydrolase family protein [Acidiferrobacterales bacterium]